MLSLDVNGDNCLIYVGAEDRWREPNVVYALQSLPWFENRITHYVFSWWDILLARGLLVDELKFEFGLTQAAHEKINAWNKHYYETESGVRFASDRQLRKFQHRDVLMYRPRTAVLLNHDMGLGKTFSGIGIGYDSLLSSKHDHIVIMCPASVKRNWARYISRHIPAPYNSVAFVEGSEAGQAWSRKAYWHLISYAKARSAIDDLDKFIQANGNPWRRNLTIYDELHRVRSRYLYKQGGGKEFVQQTKAAQQMARWSTGSVGLTANKVKALEHLYEMFESLEPKFFHSWENFSGRYMSYHPAIRGSIGYIRTDEIAKKIPLMVTRYLKGDVLEELPEQTHEPRWIELNQQERKRYDDCVKVGLMEAATANTDRRGISVNSLTITTNIRRFLDSPKLINDAWPQCGSKLNELKRMLQGNTEKVVIFSQYADACDIIADELGKENCVLYTRNAKSELYREWILDDSKIYFIMTEKGAEAIDLHGIEVEDPLTKYVYWKPGASVLVMYDEFTDPSDNEQVYGRIHRQIPDAELMKNWHAHVITFRCEGTYEEKIVKKIEENNEFAAKINSGLITFKELEELCKRTDIAD